MLKQKRINLFIISLVIPLALVSMLVTVFIQILIYKAKVESGLANLCHIAEPLIQTGSVRSAHDSLIGIASRNPVKILPVIVVNNKNLAEPSIDLNEIYKCNLDGVENIKLIFYYQSFKFDWFWTAVNLMSFSIIYFLIFNAISMLLSRKKENEIKNRILDMEIKLATQVAHDIRSPLSALNLATSKISDSTGEVQMLIKMSVNRINDIASDLLKKKSFHANALIEESNIKRASKPVNLLQAAEEIYKEKSLLWSNYKSCKVEFNAERGQSFMVVGEASSIKRIISNLLNNSFEALKDYSGNITIGLRNNQKSVKLYIIDDGKGMSNETLSQLGVAGFSFGKEDSLESGKGLGFSDAKVKIQEWGGEIVVNSKVNNGTVIELSFVKVSQ